MPKFTLVKKKKILDKEFWSEISGRLNSFGISGDKQKLLIDKIEKYLAAKDII